MKHPKKPVFLLGKTEARSRQGDRTYVLSISEVKRVLSDPKVTNFKGIQIMHRLNNQVTVDDFMVHRDAQGNVIAFGCQSLTSPKDLPLLKKWAGVA